MLLRGVFWRGYNHDIRIFSHQCMRRISSVSRSRKNTQTLPETPARTRFAPSPTGHLHIGSLRTALFNFLLAKATNGQFILRIEDTDQARTVSGAEDRLYADLRWAGLNWDEGPQVGGPLGPYRQSERRKIYQTHALELISSGKAYRCFCSAERLAQLAEERNNVGLPTNYDRTCSGISHDVSERRAADGEAHTIRFRSPRVFPKYYDLVYGNVGASKVGQKPLLKDDQYDDFVLLKSDGMPTYHLANVIDDHLMRITHVVRATEWMPSTPKHLAIYEAFQWEPPSFAHVGLLVDNNSQKLSKRDASAGLPELVEDGIFPEALTNYLALQGWSHRQKSDYLPMQELIRSFDLKFTKGNVVFDLQKLKYLQQIYARKHIEAGGAEFQQLVQNSCSAIRQNINPSDLYIPTHHTLESYVAAILRADAKHSHDPRTFWLRHIYFLKRDPVRPSPMEFGRNWILEIVAKAIAKLSTISASEWSAPNIKATIDALALEQVDTLPLDVANTGDHDVDKKAKHKPHSRISHALRWSVMGAKAGPPMGSTMEILGRDFTIERLEKSRSDINSE